MLPFPMTQDPQYHDIIKLQSLLNDKHYFSFYLKNYIRPCHSNPKNSIRRNSILDVILVQIHVHLFSVKMSAENIKKRKIETNCHQK
jgi:hypothetical protein